MDEGLKVEDVISEMDYDFTAQNEGAATVEDTEIKDYDVLYSK